MNKDRRFGRRIAEPSSVQIIHELKLMALRQSLDVAMNSEAAGTAPPGDGDAAARGSSTPPSDPV